MPIGKVLHDLGLHIKTYLPNCQLLRLLLHETYAYSCNRLTRRGIIISDGLQNVVTLILY